jgi:hypothetical protein
MAAQQRMYSPTVAFTKSGGTFYVQQQQQAHHPPSLLQLQAERETSNATTAKGLDMLCMIAPPIVFWS